MRRWRRARIFAYALLALLGALALALASRSRGDIPLETLKSRYAPAPSRFIDVSGMSVHYRDEGAGPAIVLLHGTSASLHTWDGWASALAGAHRVIRVDLPGFGLTGPHPSDDYHVNTYVTFLERFLDVLNVPAFVLVGNSLGGGIAWHFALAHPARVRALVLVDSGGYPVNVSSRPLAFRVAQLPLVPRLFTFLDPRPFVVDGVTKSYGQPSRIREGVIERYYELTLRPGNREAFVARMKTPYPDDTHRLSELHLPVLILWGARDRVIPVEMAHRFDRIITDSRLVIYDDLGHIPMEEDPGRTVADVLRFMAALR